MFYHPQVSCKSEKCDYKNCQNRHQKECKFFNLNNFCKHGSNCEFKHLKKKIKTKEDSLEIKDRALEDIIKAKDYEIKNLKNSIEERKLENDNLISKYDSIVDDLQEARKANQLNDNEIDKIHKEKSENERTSKMRIKTLEQELDDKTNECH